MTLAHRFRSGQKKDESSSGKKWLFFVVLFLVLALSFVIGKFAGDYLFSSKRTVSSSAIKQSSDNIKKKPKVFKNKKPSFVIATLNKGNFTQEKAKPTEYKKENPKSVKVRFVSQNKTRNIFNNKVGSFLVKGVNEEEIRKLKLIEEATSAFKNRNYAKAIELYNKVLDLDPKNSKALLNLATIYYQIGDKLKARELFIKLLRIEPKNPSVLNNLGVIYMGEGRYKLALSYFNKALRINPAFKAALLNKGLCLEKMGKGREASKIYAYGIKLYPNEYRFYLYLGVYLYNKGATEDAYRFLSKAYQLMDDKDTNVGIMLRKILER